MTALLPAEATRAEAYARAERIRAGIVAFGATLADISEAYHRRDWQALGYDSWDAYVSGEFGTDRLRLPPEQRREIVSSLRADSLSTRAIASVVGVHQTTVLDDLRAGDGFPSPAPVAGLDGKTYPPPAEPEIIEAELVEDEPAAVWSPEEGALLQRLRAGETVVVNLRSHGNLIEWATATGLFERIDRRTDWGNPYETPADGDRDTVIANYAGHFLPYKPSLLARLPELRGKALGCWCAPEACHGDVLKAEAEP